MSDSGAVAILHKYETCSGCDIRVPRYLLQIPPPIHSLEHYHAPSAHKTTCHEELVTPVLHMPEVHTADLLQACENLGNELQTAPSTLPIHLLHPMRAIVLPVGFLQPVLRPTALLAFSLHIFMPFLVTVIVHRVRHRVDVGSARVATVVFELEDRNCISFGIRDVPDIPVAHINERIRKLARRCGYQKFSASELGTFRWVGRDN